MTEKPAKPEPVVEPLVEAEKPVPKGHVTVRVTKFGAGKVSTGEYVVSVGNLYHEAGDMISVPREVGEALEKRGFGEIQ